MTTIRQEYIIEAAAAISTLGQLQQALAGVNTQLRRTVNTPQNSGAATAGSQAAQATRSTNELTVSWQTMLRVVQTQITVAFLGRIRREISESITQAAELQERIGLIQTLQNQAPQTNVNPGGTDFQTFDELNQAVVDISNQFNIPVIEAATAAYDALSNQLGSAEEALRFTGDAALFARATGSSLTDSVDLLSAAIVSFEIPLSRTSEVSSLFFNIIDQGRITADELANTFGRIGAPARQLGVTIEDLGGIISAISVQGFRTSETLTQFRGIITSLSRPSSELDQALQQIGFSSAQVATESIGLVETLRLLQQSTEGNNEAFFRLFPNIRSSTGVLALLARDADELTISLESMAQASDRLAEERALLVIQTDAELLSNTANRLRNQAIGLGDSFIGLTADAINFVGGAEQIVGVVETAIAALSGLAIGAIAVSTQMIAARVSTEAFLSIATRSGPLLVLTAALTAAGVAVARFREQSRDIGTEDGEEAFESLSTAATVAQIRINAALRQLRNSSQTIFRDLGEEVRQLALEYNESRDDIIAANAEIVSEASTALDALISSREAIAQEFEAQAQGIENSIGRSMDAVTSLEDDISQRNFDFNTSGLDDSGLINALGQRADLLAAEAQQLFAAGGEDNIARGRELFRQSQSEAERAVQIGNAADNRQLELQAIRNINRLQNDQINAERQLQEAQEQRQQVAEAAAARQRASLRELREAQAVILDNVSPLNADGSARSVEEQAAADEALRGALDTLRDQALNNEDLDAANLLGLGNLGARISEQINTISPETQIEVDISSATGRLRERLESTIVGFRESNSELVTALEGFIDGPIRTIEDLARAVIAANQATRDASQSVGDSQLADNQVVVTREASEASAENFNDNFVFERVPEGTSGFFRDEGVAITQAEFLQALQSGLENEVRVRIQTDDVNGFGDVDPINRSVTNASVQGFDVLQDLREREASSQEIRAVFQSFTEGVSEAGTALASVVGPSQALRANVEQGFQNAINEAQARETAEATTRITASPEVLENLGTLQTLVTEREGATVIAENQARELTTVAETISRIRREGLENIDVNINVTETTNNVPPANQQFGGAGLQFFNNGGLARGVDTIPAMLAPGESVINARSTQRFFSQIQALNAGQTPVFRAQNGGTTNVGDISVTVQGDSGNPAKTGRQIAQSLNRELRRRTSRL